MKKMCLSLLFFSIFSGLFSKGFMFYNKTGRPLALSVVAVKENGSKESMSFNLKPDTIYTREDWSKIDQLKATTLKREAGWFDDKEVITAIEKEEVLSKTWERDIRSENDKIRKIKLYIKNNSLRYKSSWLNTCKRCK